MPAVGIWLGAYVAAVVYATLHPWSGWRTPGRWMFAFLSDPWPRWWTGFDVAANVAAYLPIGLLLTVWLARRLSLAMTPAAVLATLGGAALSLGLECLQALLPGRQPLVMVEGRCHTPRIGEFEPALRRFVASLAQTGGIPAH